MVRLYLEDDAGNVRIVPWEADEVSIGRAEDNTIVLPDRNISRHHARLRAINGRFFVEDAGARYGVFLNGNRVDGRGEVRPGDLIGLGDHKVKVLPGEGEAEGVEKEDRRGTVPEIPVMADRPGEASADEPFSDTSLISLRDMERVARQGWPSDFEGRDEVAQKKSMARRLVFLMVLVAVAALLVLAYLWVTQPTEIETTAPPTRVAEPSLEPPEPPLSPPAPAPAKVEAPGKPSPAPEVSPGPTPVVTPPARLARETTRGTGPAKPEETPRTVAVVEPKPQRPATRPPASPQKPAMAEGGDAMGAIEAAIQGGRLAEARQLLDGFRGAECVKYGKKIGGAYQGRKEIDKAVSAYRKAQSCTTDSREKSRIQSMIDALKPPE